MVTINVSIDEDAETFLVYKDFLCYYSPFFDAAFNGGFQESSTQHLDLPDVCPKVFDAFVNWLYSQNVASESKAKSQLALFVDLWLLGDRLLIPKLQNQALVAFDKLRVSLWTRHVAVYSRIYENTVHGSPLRRYITQIAASGFSINAPLRAPESHTRDLLLDMVDFMRTGLREDWIEFSEEGLEQFFVKEGEAAESQEKGTDK